MYASAAYEDALALATRLDTGEAAPDVEPYRVFCLVALGKLEEAERAAEAVIRLRPRYRPEPSEVSPRIQDLFSKARRKLGPSIVKSMYIDAKAALDRKDRDAAIAGFEEMLRVADDPDVKDESTISELRLLGSGFLDLSRALSMVAAAAAPAPAPPVPQPPVRSVVVPPVALREALPPWMPTDATSRFAEYRGAVRVEIDADGKVSAAEMLVPVHPSYDRLLLQSTRDWSYQPARANGVPVPSEKVVQVVLKPR